MSVSCSRKAYQENIRAKCRYGTHLTAERTAKGELLLCAEGLPVGTVSGSRQAEFEDNAHLVRDITVSKLTENDKGKMLLGAEVKLGI